MRVISWRHVGPFRAHSFHTSDTDAFGGRITFAKNRLPLFRVMRVSSGRITFAKNRFPLFRVMRVSGGRITFAKNRFPLFRVML
ncbi:hypothetical protein [Novosphingobium sp.]|uniref:hypothetical protein n=1 Tax=Novosphingobium sp. TaxID=1874826 RepID=UPI0031D054D5